MPSPVIIVSGASRGLGLAIARCLLSVHGANIATMQRTLTPELKALTDEYPGRVLNITGDVSKPEDNARAVKETVDKYGVLNGLILNAGTLEPMGKLSEVPLDKVMPAFGINLLSGLYMVQPAIEHLRKSASAANPSRVIMVSSGAATTAYQAWGVYSATKAAMNSFARTLAAEEKDANVAFLSVRPGVVDMQVHIRASGPSVMDPTEMAKFNGLHQEGQLLHPDQPGYVIAGCSVGMPLEASGEFVNWSDDRFKQFQKA